MSAALSRAARGMAAIAAAAPVEERASLAYVALYACGYGGRGALARYQELRLARADARFLHGLAEQVTDDIPVMGWTVSGWTEDLVFLEKGGIRAFIGRRRIPGRHLVAGSQVSFRVSALAAGSAPGFVVRRPRGVLPAQGLSRFYLNIGPSAAAWVLGPLARACQREADVSVKVLAHPRAYVRRDACVIYVPSGQVGRLFRIITGAIARDRIRLGATVPLFTLRLADGVGFADEPSDLGDPGTSHGQWVSSLFARAADQSPDPAGIADSVVGSVRQCGRDPEYPFLRAGRTLADLGL